MLVEAKTYLATLGGVRIILWILVLASVIEAITLILRFWLGVQSTRDTSVIGYFTFGLRIHHGYVGAILILIGLLRPEPLYLRNLGIIIGGALLLSDLVHHFFVLWPITGSPEFHLTYPRTPTDP